MTRKTLLIVFIFLLLASGFAAASFAQQQAPPPPPRGGRGMQGGMGMGSGDVPPNPADVQAWFDAMVLVQAQRALGLTDAQYPQFVGKLKALQDTRRRNQRARAQLVQEIGRLTAPKAPPADDAVLRDKLKALDDLQAKSAGEIRRAYEQLDQVLDVHQQARFRVFEEQIERRKFEILLNARRRAGRGAQ